MDGIVRASRAGPLAKKGRSGHRIGKRPWLTVFRFPTYTPDLNPAEGVWAHLKKSLGNLAPCSIDGLAGLARTRLKRMQYRPDLLDGFIAETGLITTPP
ncbi:transposase [Streptomyces sp. NPDC050535]|uniref:transposase n=1 Tax=Streptomyces sp. NPDC050535 TaxID=3365626 RepID=UPI0037946523